MPRLESFADPQQRRMLSGWPGHLDPFLNTTQHTMQQIYDFHLRPSSTPWCHTNSDAEGCTMPAETTLDLLPAETDEAPAPKRDTPQKLPERPANMPTASGEATRARRRWLARRALFTLLPLALIGGAYWYVTGGRVMSTDDAYVNAETVGISTDVSGIVQQIDVTENQHVDSGQVLY